MLDIQYLQRLIQKSESGRSETTAITASNRG